jgi:hypothetical protein
LRTETDKGCEKPFRVTHSPLANRGGDSESKTLIQQSDLSVERDVDRNVHEAAQQTEERRRLQIRWEQ